MNKHPKHAGNNKTGRLNLSSLMPHDELSKQLLQERANILAKSDHDYSEKSENSVNYIKFKIGANEQYGIPFDEMLDVKLADHITRVPMVPAYVVGISYWHSKLIPVIDIGIYLNFTKLGDQAKSKYIAAIENDKSIVGILFDDVVGVDEYEIDDLDKNININPKVKDSYVYGIHDGKTTILNVQNIIQVISSELTLTSGGGYEKSE